MTYFDVVVVGAGVVGSSVAHYCQKAGFKTALLEKFPFPHSRGSSHGQTRNTRKCYPESRELSKMMDECMNLWVELEQESGTKLFKTTGGLFVENGNKLLLKKSYDVMKDLGYGPVWLNEDELKKKYPMVDYSGFSAVFDKDAGILFADKTVQTFNKLFLKNGGTFIDSCEVISAANKDDSVVLNTTNSNHPQIKCKKVFFCPGPWAAECCKMLGLQLPVRPVCIDLVFWRPAVPELFSSDTFPTITDIRGWHAMHMFSSPVHEYPGLMKLIVPQYNTQSHHPDRRDQAEHATLFDDRFQETYVNYVQRHFPSFETTPSVRERCIYTKTPDEQYCIGPHPLNDRVHILCGFNGHGFKMGPIIGKLMSEVAAGKTPRYDFSSFALERFGNPVARKTEIAKNYSSM